MSDDDKPEPSVNPYESPRVPAESSERPADELQANARRERRRFILLGVAILLSCVSLVPWLGAIFVILSAPLFLRYYFTERRLTPALRAPSLTVQGAGVLGTILMCIFILAAAAGACLGTCTASVYAIAIPAAVVADNRSSVDLFYGALGRAFVVGGIAGAVAFFLSSIWLFRRPWRDS